MNKFELQRKLDAYLNLLVMTHGLEESLKKRFDDISPEIGKSFKELLRDIKVCDWEEIKVTEKLLLEKIPAEYEDYDPCIGEMTFIPQITTTGKLTSCKIEVCVPGGKLGASLGFNDAYGCNDSRTPQADITYTLDDGTDTSLAMAEIKKGQIAVENGLVPENRDIEVSIWDDPYSEDCQDPIVISNNDIHIATSDLRHDIYIRFNSKELDGHTIHVMWSENEPCSDDAIGVIGIYTYDRFGNESTRLDSGEFDVHEDGGCLLDGKRDSKNLLNYLPEVFEFIGVSEDTPYVFISEREFEGIRLFQARELDYFDQDNARQLDLSARKANISKYHLDMSAGEYFGVFCEDEMIAHCSATKASDYVYKVGDVPSIITDDKDYDEETSMIIDDIFASEIVYKGVNVVDMMVDRALCYGKTNGAKTVYFRMIEPGFVLKYKATENLASILGRDVEWLGYNSEVFKFTI